MRHSLLLFAVVIAALCVRQVVAQTTTRTPTPAAHCAPGYTLNAGVCLVGGRRYTKPVGTLAAGPTTLMKLENSAIVFETVYQYGSNPVRTDASGRCNGAYEVNITAPRNAWFLEYQRAGGLDVIAGVLRDEPKLIDDGLCIFHWGLARQAKNGSFPGSAWPFHGTAMFLSEAAPALVILSVSQYASRYAAEMKWEIARMRKAAHYMVRYVHGPQHIDDTTKNHRLYEAAIALGGTGILAGDPTLVRWSQMYARRGIRMERPDGVMPENGGHDSGYQALGMTSAARYYALVASGKLRTALYAALQKGEAWERSRIRSDGSINQAGDTRTVDCKERDPAGHCKSVFSVPIVAAMARWSAITGDANYAQAARLVHRHG